MTVSRVEVAEVVCEIATRLNAQGVGIFATVAPHRFASTPLGEYLRYDVPGSLGGWARFIGHDLTWRPWGRLANSVRTEKKAAFDHVFNCALFSYLSEHREVAAVFNKAMTAVSTMGADAVLKGLPAQLAPAGEIPWAYL